jgi:hypothetical protein
LRIIVAGIIGRYPFGGVTWCSLMYLLGLRNLGHDVYYLEDTGECIYDYAQNTLSLDSSYGLNYIHSALSQFDLGDRWTFIDYRGEYFGKSRNEMVQICAGTDLFVNLSGGCWFWRDEYTKVPRKIFIDSDPGFTQIRLAKGEDPSLVEFFKGFNALFTFGRNLDASDCTIPATPFRWRTTWQPIVTDQWRSDVTPRDCFTTVMTWKNQSFADIDGNKDRQFAKFVDLPALTVQPIELAVNGPKDLLREHGWAVVDGMMVSSDLNKYRDYIQRSKAEFSVAKHVYVTTRSGWFSDRTECYLAAGRPALVQDTGFSRYLPVGEGLLSFSNLDEAVDGIDRINADYRLHSRRARDLAREHFDARVVLPQLLDETHAASNPRSGIA